AGGAANHQDEQCQDDERDHQNPCLHCTLEAAVGVVVAVAVTVLLQTGDVTGSAQVKVVHRQVVALALDRLLGTVNQVPLEAAAVFRIGRRPTWPIDVEVDGAAAPVSPVGGGGRPTPLVLGI